MSKSSEQNKTKGNGNSSKNKAVALRYRLDEDAAPVVIASGYGMIADKIIGIAEEEGIPVFKDDSAASMLCMLEVGRHIPAELYEVIAAIYTQILSVSSKIKRDDAPKSSGEMRAATEMRKRILDGGTDKK